MSFLCLDFFLSALSFLLGLYPPRNQTLNVSYVDQVFRAPYDIQQVSVTVIVSSFDFYLGVC